MSNSHTKFAWILSNGLGGDSITDRGDYNTPFALLNKHGDKNAILLSSFLIVSCTIPARLHIQYPMLFKLTNKKMKRETHCGVLEFVADEGRIYIPYWVCSHF